MDLLNAILNNIDEALIITDPDGKILFFNEVAQTHSRGLMLSAPLREGEMLFNVASATRRDSVTAIFKDLKNGKRPDKYMAEYLNAQRATVYLEFSYVPVLDDKKILTNIFVFVRDVTSQKVFEKTLITQTTNINSLLEHANAIIIGVDALGYVTEWNEHCTKILGFSKEEVFAKKLTEILENENEMTKQESQSNIEMMVLTKRREKRTLLLSTTPRKTSTGNIVGFTLVGQDVTELTEYRRFLERKVDERTQELQMALKKQQEILALKSKFVSMASHEFRIPLSTIQYGINMTRMNLTLDDDLPLKDTLNGIETQVRHMTHLLDDVLTFGKNEGEKINVLRSSIQLHTFLAKLIEEVTHSTARSHVILSNFIQLPEVIFSDEKLLRNIIINLLTNAIKFSPDKKFVEIIVKRHASDLVITVRDEGIGIPLEETDKVFEPFLRGKDVTSIPGTGLGLSIVKKAVELLQATIVVQSSLGEGTTFTVTLPSIVSA